MGAAKMKKPTPFRFCRLRHGKQFFVAFLVFFECFAESGDVSPAKVEFPGSKGPADLSFHHFQQELAVCLCEKLSWRQVRHGFFQRLHVSPKWYAEKKWVMRRTCCAISVTATIRQCPHHGTKIEAADAQFPGQFKADDFRATAQGAEQGV